MQHRQLRLDDNGILEYLRTSLLHHHNLRQIVSVLVILITTLTTILVILAAPAVPTPIQHWSTDNASIGIRTGSRAKESHGLTGLYEEVKEGAEI